MSAWIITIWTNDTIIQNGGNTYNSTGILHMNHNGAAVGAMLTGLGGITLNSVGNTASFGITFSNLAFGSSVAYINMLRLM